MEIFQVFVTMFSKWSAADLLYVGKGSSKCLLVHIDSKSIVGRQIACHGDFCQMYERMFIFLLAELGSKLTTPGQSFCYQPSYQDLDYVNERNSYRKKN